MVSFGDKLPVVATRHRSRDDDARARARASSQRVAGSHRGAPVIEEAEHRRAAAGHRRLRRTGATQRADEPGNFRMPLRDRLLEVVANVRLYTTLPVGVPP